MSLAGYFSFLAVISTRLFKLPRNTSLFAALLTGVASGYFLSQATLDTCLKRMERDANARNNVEKDFGPVSPYGEDRYATTRGDHWVVS